MLIITPEHMRVFRDAQWTKAHFREELSKLLMLPGQDMIRGANGIAEGIPAHFVDATVPKFREGGLLIVHAGGGAGMWSAVVGGWASGATGSSPVTVAIQS